MPRLQIGVPWPVGGILSAKDVSTCRTLQVEPLDEGVHESGACLHRRSVRRGRSRPVTRQIHSDDAVAGLDQRRDLIPPRRGGGCEARRQHHARRGSAVTVHGVVDSSTAGFDGQHCFSYPPTVRG
ncbi:hypothetical protein RHA1_ro00220 [Rhodococcus jostii RHA1]|uniref:Uncharacterized protein n=1 Tax=Rhodococcus jostii (strain RHA1) TaxID=101510 RepID=Q0SK80_RHOJR|nr:hypothetical protein RHA1_ro00220 [Rhodococcus jostii RHA1]